MSFQIINLIHAFSLMSISLWMYKSSVNPNIGQLLPFMAGIILLALNNGVKEGSVEQKKVAFYITIVVLLSMLFLLMVPNDWSEEGFHLNIVVMVIMALFSAMAFVYESFNKKPKAK